MAVWNVRVEQLGSHWIDIHTIWYFGIFQKSVEKIQVLFKSDKNNVYFIQQPVYIYDNILLNYS